MYNITPDITEEYILKNLSQEQIMEYYIGVTVKVKKKFSSPFRKDKHPSCSLIYRDGNLIFKDFASSVKGNCFHIAMHSYSCTYYEALERIAEDFNLTSTTTQKVPKKEYTHLEADKAASDKPTLIRIKHRGWKKADKKYWFDQFGLTRKVLKHFNTIPIQTAWVNDTIIYNYYGDRDPCYAYRLGQNKYKLYFPLRKDPKHGSKFIHNTTKVQGYRQLPKTGKYLVITKSMKDVMVLYSFGISAIALASETMYPPEGLIDTLKTRFNYIYSFYDFDYAGIVMANHIKRTYNIRPLLLSNGTRGAKTNYGAKDIAEYVNRFGKETTKALIRKIKNHLRTLNEKQHGETELIPNNEIPY